MEETPRDARSDVFAPRGSGPKLTPCPVGDGWPAIQPWISGTRKLAPLFRKGTFEMLQNQNSPATVEASISALTKPATDEIAALARNVSGRAAPVLEQFGWAARVGTRYAIQRATAAGLVRVTQAKVDAAVATAVSQYIAAQNVSRMVITAQAMRDESNMQRIRAVALAEFTSQVLEISTVHEDRIDEGIAASTRARCARTEQGLISPERAEQRRAREEERAERLIRRFEDEIDDMIERFRLRLRQRLDELFAS
jgi:hypothetical protein